jgi:hypothetical protein
MDTDWRFDGIKDIVEKWTTKKTIDWLQWFWSWWFRSRRGTDFGAVRVLIG